MQLGALICHIYTCKVPRLSLRGQSCYSLHVSPLLHASGKNNPAHTQPPEGKALPPIQHPDSLPCNTGAVTAVEEGLRHRRAPLLPLGDRGCRAGLAVPAPSTTTCLLWGSGAGELAKDILCPLWDPSKATSQ